MLKDSTTCISLFTVAVNRLIVIALLCLAPFLSALAINAGYSGTWYYPAQDGHGFSIEISEFSDGTPVGIVIWYIYDDQGNPMFMVGEGEPQADLLEVSFVCPWGMEFGVFDPRSVYREDGGTGLFEFTGENSATFNYTPSTYMEQELGHSPINIPLVKLLDYSPLYDLPLGKGYDIYATYADRTEVREAILDGPALAKARRIMSFDLEQSEYTSIQGIDINEYASSLTQSAGVEGNYLGFAGAIKQSFDRDRYTSNEYSFATVAVVIAKQAHIITDRQDVESLKPFLHRNFSKRLNDPGYPPTDLFRMYGTHAMTGIIMGARMNYNVSAATSLIDQNLSIGVFAEASYNNALMGVAVEFGLFKEEAWKAYKSTERKSLQAVGGVAEYAIEIANKGDYEDWLHSIDERPVFSAYFPDSLTGIWEFCDDEERKADIYDFFLDWKEERTDFLPDRVIDVPLAILDLFVGVWAGPSVDIDGHRYYRIDMDLNGGVKDSTDLALYVAVGEPEIDTEKCQGLDWPFNCPITNLVLYNFSDERDIPPANSFIRAGEDLNKGAGGDDIFLYYTKAMDWAPVRAVKVLNWQRWAEAFSPGASNDQIYREIMNTEGKSQDVNEGAGGEDVFLYFSRDYIDDN